MAPKDIALALLIVVLWGVNFVVMKYAVSEVPPFLLTAVRFSLAAIPAVFFVAPPAVAWRHVLVYGLGFGVLQFGFMFTAFRLGLPSGLAAVLLQTQALITIALAYGLLGERTTAPQRWGIAIIAAGVATIIAGAGLGSGQGMGQGGLGQGVALLPVLLMLGAASGWAMANIALKRARPTDLFAFTVWTSLMPAVTMLGLSAVAEGPAAWAASWAGLTGLGAAAVLYLAYPVSLGSGMAWASLMSRYPAAAFAPFALLVPVIGMAGGAVVYGERLSAMGIAGSALILAGLAVLLAAGRRTPAALKS